MPPNNRRRRVASNAVGRTLINKLGGPDMRGRREKGSGASEFHEMPHLAQEHARVSDFLQGDPKRAVYQSVLERNALDEFMLLSMNAQNEYDAQHAVQVLVKQRDGPPLKVATDAVQGGLALKGEELLHSEGVHLTGASTRIIPIPRRPVNYASGKDVPVISPAELAQKEEGAFLEWRLELAKIEEVEGRVMTPFEKNLEFWRQLWRVLERSDLVVSILDARDPIFFRSVYLERYVREINRRKDILLLLNKSDLIPSSARRQWLRYFRSQGIGCLFFSALDELKRQGNAMATENLSEVNKVAASPSTTLSSVPPDNEANSSLQPSRLQTVSEEGGEGDKDDDEDDTDGSTSDGSSEGEGDNKGEGVEVTDDGIVEKEGKSIEPGVMSPQVEEALDVEWGEAIDPSSGRPSAMSESSFWKSYDGRVLNAGQLMEALRVLGEGIRSSWDDEISDEADINSDDGEELEESDSDDEVESDGGESEDKKTDSEDDPEEGVDYALKPDKSKLRKGKRRLYKTKARTQSDPVVIGFVGYPNVGKSSVINSLLGDKRVSVSQQPGKTKHFQTLLLPSHIGLTLCDCPGLVFPQIVSTKDHLIINSVAPIDTLRSDFLSPVQLVCDSIPIALVRRYNLNPMHFSSASSLKLLESNQSPANTIRADTLLLSNTPGVSKDSIESWRCLLGKRLNAEKFLTLLALSRGYISGGKGGQPDLFKTAKMVLKDYTAGGLPHWTLPPQTVEEKAVGQTPGAMDELVAGRVAIPGTTKKNVAGDEDDSDDGDEGPQGLLADLVENEKGPQRETKITKRKARFLMKRGVKSKGSCNVVDWDTSKIAMRGLASCRALN